MKNYAKLQNGTIEFPQRQMMIGDFNVENPTEEQLVEAGFKEVIFSQPEEKKWYTPNSRYEEKDTQILQLWDYEKVPAPDYDLLVETKIAERYSTGKEISINRKGMLDAQHPAYLEYISFIEKCKEDAQIEVTEWENA